MKYTTTIQPYGEGELKQPGPGWRLVNFHVLGDQEKLICAWSCSGELEQLQKEHRELVHEFANYRGWCGSRNIRARGEMDSAMHQTETITSAINAWPPAPPREHEGERHPQTSWLEGVTTTLKRLRDILSEQISDQQGS